MGTGCPSTMMTDIVSYTERFAAKAAPLQMEATLRRPLGTAKERHIRHRDASARKPRTARWHNEPPGAWHTAYWSMFFRSISQLLSVHSPHDAP